MGYEKSNISVLVPTRGRPKAMYELSKAFAETCTSQTELHWIVDQNDLELEEYRASFTEAPYPHKNFWTVPKGPPGIVHPLNYVAKILTNKEEGLVSSCVLGFMGDDHRPRTRGWDEVILETTAQGLRPKMVYGDDLIQGERLPTAAFLSTRVIKALGFMAPPELKHLYVDDFWRDLANAVGIREYRPELVFEHMHYSVGKSVQDETYDQNNNSKSASKDRVAYMIYKKSLQLARDVKKVRDIL